MVYELRGARVLAIDDTSQNLQLIAAILAREGANIFLANSGEQGLAKARSVKPDVILLDVMMPGMDGYEVCAALKAMPEAADTPVIFLTAKSEKDDVLEGFKAGAVDYVTKPFNQFELVARVRAHAELKAARDLLRRQNAEREIMLRVLSHDIRNLLAAPIYLLESLEGDGASDFFHKNRPVVVEALRNGLNLISLLRSLRCLLDSKYTLDLEPVEIADAVGLAISIVKPSFKGKGTVFACDVPDGLKAKADPSSLAHIVLANIISNAAKFSPPGAEVSITARDMGDSVRIQVSDSGVGMPPEIIACLFDMGSASLRQGTAGETGTGHGLAVAKRFMEACGGQIEIESRCVQSNPDNSGTTVTLTLSKAD